MSEFEHYAAKEFEAVNAQLIEEPNFFMKILRGHFLIEQKLNDLLDLCLKHPEVLTEQKAPRLNFHTKTYIVRSIAPKPPSSPWIWPSVAKLNSIRNMMAHSLESEKLDKAIREFVVYLKVNNQIYAKGVAEFTDLTLEKECEFGIASIYAFLTVYTQKIREESNSE